MFVDTVDSLFCLSSLSLSLSLFFLFFFPCSNVLIYFLKKNSTFVHYLKLTQEEIRNTKSLLADMLGYFILCFIYLLSYFWMNRRILRRLYSERQKLFQVDFINKDVLSECIRSFYIETHVLLTIRIIKMYINISHCYWFYFVFKFLKKQYSASLLESKN